MQLRLATPIDLEGIKSCARAAYSQYIAVIGREPAPMVADFQNQIAAGRVHLAEMDGKILGFIVFFQTSDVMFLENVAVDPAMAGRGIGKALISLCENAARDAGVTAVTLYTNVAMTANQSLYPYLGYEETHRHTDDGFHRVYYRKSIA